MNNAAVSKKSVIILLLLLIGIIVSLTLIKNPTIFKSKAAADIDYPSALNITDEQNQQLNYKGEGVYIIKDNKIKIGVKDFDKLIQNKQIDLTAEYSNLNGKTPDELIKMGLVKISENEVTKSCATDAGMGGWYCSLLDWDVIKGSYGDTWPQFFTVNQYPPLSEIPKSCNSVGPTIVFQATPPIASKFWLDYVRDLAQRTMGDEYVSRTEKETGQSYSYSPGSSSLTSFHLPNTNYLPIRWEGESNKPFTQGGEDVRYMIRALLMIATLKQSWPLPEDSRPLQAIGPKEFEAYWNDPNGLDRACEEVLRLKEEILLKGIWLPTDDTLEKISPGLL